MRFFKSFKLLHRRTKSDPINAIISDFSRHNHTSSISNGISRPFLTALARSAPESAIHPSIHLNLRILDLETENSSLRVATASSLNELTELRSQLKATQVELYAELHRGVRQRREDTSEIERLRETLAQYEPFLELVVNADPNRVFLADAHVSLRNGHALDQALLNAVKRTTTTDAPGDVPSLIGVPSVLGLRSHDEYQSALQLTLKSRMQLRQSKKIAKFWKNTATEDGKNTHVVTPSPSAISSICEALPAERQKAVDDLIARRKSNPRHFYTPVRTPLHHEALVTSSMPPVNSGSTSLAHLPSSSRPSLSPLASQSLRQELVNISSKNRMSKWPSGLGRKPLGQIDLNPRNTALIAPSHPITPRKKFSSSVSDPFGPTHGESESFVKASIDDLVSPPRARLVDSERHSLTNIVEENESRCESSPSSNDVSREWVTCDSHQEDASFGSNAETLIHASPITPPKKRALIKAETAKSRLPIPVFRSLKRLSSMTLATVIGNAAPSSLPPKPKIPVRSPTRLPVRPSAKSR
ncbi:hypothetical protein DXG03_009472 [Asterophora parasitica]|uniref:Uncharacterized protein n=1 Tax=Asterophora parasitica TaxID=117018 RepID=A0A9P7K9W3_9AGAR|nr:hypothetical protein DXG03_009472 [Asterophora parasitica]